MALDAGGRAVDGHGEFGQGRAAVAGASSVNRVRSVASRVSGAAMAGGTYCTFEQLGYAFGVAVFGTPAVSAMTDAPGTGAGAGRPHRRLSTTVGP